MAQTLYLSGFASVKRVFNDEKSLVFLFSTDNTYYNGYLIDATA